jgi:hypothetical protein
LKEFLLHTEGKLIATLNHIHGKIFSRQDFQTGILGSAYLCLPVNGLISLKDVEVSFDGEIEIP